MPPVFDALHLLLESFEPKDWIFDGQIATHRSGYFVEGSLTKEDKFLWAQAPNDDRAYRLSKFSTLETLDLPSALDFVHQRLSLHHTHDLQQALKGALVQAGFHGAWIFDIEPASLLCIDDGQKLDTAQHLLGADLYQAFLRFKDHFFPEAPLFQEDPGGEALYQSPVRVVLPDTLHARLAVLKAQPRAPFGA